MVSDYSYAYQRIRDWHVPPVGAAVLALRYAITGDTGRFRTHAGFKVTRLRRTGPEEEN